MHHHYEDIRNLTAEPPAWWDEHAVPRYCSFSPHQVANIYADEVVLMIVDCQGCGRHFRVARSSSLADRVIGAMGLADVDALPTLAERIAAGSIYYGDPPNADCCPAGPTMNSEPIAVLEYWRRAPAKSGGGFERDRRLERVIPRDDHQETFDIGDDWPSESPNQEEHHDDD